MSTDELVGVWRLLSYFDIDEAGSIRVGPLGSAPKGLLIYNAQGYMSVSMMRTDEDDPLQFMGYSGKWRLAGERVIHEVMVSTHQHLVDTELVREWKIHDDRLTIHGTALIRERPQRRVLDWQRA